MSENTDDLTESKKQGNGKSAGKKAVEGAKKAADTAQKMKKAGIAVKLVAALWWVALIVVIIFLIIGAYSFIVTLPGMMLDKIVETVGGFWDSLSSFFVGNSVYIKDSDQTELANYIDNMGYDVVGYGFAPSKNIKLAKKEKSDDTAEEDDETTSQYLKAYLLADYNTYATSGGFLDNVGTFLGEAFGAKVLKGMLVFKSEEAGLDFSVQSVDRQAKTITFKTWNPKWDSWFNSDTYTFDLDGWAGRYGKPLEFLLTLHISTMAPDLAYKLASEDAFDTKVYIGYESVDAWITTRYVVNEETVKNLKELDKNDDTKNQVIWNIEGLEDLKKKIDGAGKLELDKETLDKIKELLDEQPDEYEAVENAFECVKGWNDYFKEAVEVFGGDKLIEEHPYAQEGGVPGWTYADQYCNRISGIIDWIEENNYPGADDPPPQTVETVSGMTDYMNDLLEDDDDIDFNKDPEYYTDIIDDLEELRQDLTDNISDEYAKFKSQKEEKGNKFTNEDAKKIFSKTKKTLESTINLLDELYKNGVGYKDEDGNHVDGDLEILNDNSKEAQELRSDLEKALLEIGLTPKAIDEAADLNEPEEGTSIKAIQPHINYVSKAWYRNVYFVINSSVLSDPDVQDDEFIKDWIANKKGNFTAYVTKSDSKISLPEYVFEPGDGTDQEDMKSIEGKGEFLISEMRNSSTTQSVQPKKGAINKNTKELFVGSGNQDVKGKNPKPEYFIYDGTEATAKEIESMKKQIIEKGLKETEINSIDKKDVYRKIDINKNSLAAFSILENMKTDDADFILRDFKDFLVELKYFKKSDLEDKNVGVMDWIIPDYEPTIWPLREYEKSKYNYGTWMLSKSTMEKIKEIDGSFDADTGKIVEKEGAQKNNNAKQSSLINNTAKSKPGESNSKVNIRQESGFGYYDIYEVDGVDYKHYNQGHPDVATHPFDAGNIQSYGCGPTTSAIVASAYGSESTPIDMADKMQERTLTNIISLIKNDVGIDGKEYGMGNGDEEAVKNIRKALSEGKPVPVLIRKSANDPRSTPVYSGNGHFLVIVAEDDDGLVLVNPGAQAIKNNFDPLGLEGFVRDYMGSNCIGKTGYIILDEAPKGAIMQGFESGLNVITPGIGTVTKKDATSIEIKFTQNNIIKDMTLKISGFEVKDDINVGDELESKQEIGVTTEDNIKLLLKTANKSIIENIEDYMPPPLQEEGGNGPIDLGDDYCVDTEIEESNVIRNVEDFKRIFSEYQNIVDNAEYFIQYQEEYHVNAVFAACVTIIESSGGTNWAAISSSTYNWFSIKGSYNGNSYNGWRSYPSFEAAIEDFCNLIRNGDYYIKAGKNTVKQIAEPYCNTEWGVNVVKEMTKRLEML